MTIRSTKSRAIHAATIAAVLVGLSGSVAPSRAADATVGVTALGTDGLTVNVTALNTVEKSGSFQLSIDYTLTNATVDRKIDEGAFKLFFTDGSSEPQYGFFGSLFPSDTTRRTYTWEFLKAKTPLVIEYGASLFFAKEPSSSNPQWWLAPKPAPSTTPTPTATPTASTPAIPTDAAGREARLQVLIPALYPLWRANVATLADLFASRDALLQAARAYRNDKQVAQFFSKVPGVGDEPSAIPDSALTDAASAQLWYSSRGTTMASMIASLAAWSKTLNASILRAAKTASRARTVICVRSKQTKKVTAVNPKCPTGWKLKK